MNILAPVLLAGSIAGLLQLVDLDRPGQFSWETPGGFGAPMPAVRDSFGVLSPGARDDIGVLYDMRGDAPVLADPRQQLLVPPIPAIGECFTLTGSGVLESTACGNVTAPGVWSNTNGNTSGWAPWPGLSSWPP